MKRDIRTIDLFRRLAEEAPGVKFKWSSYVEADMNNVIHAEGSVGRDSLRFSNSQGANAYGQSRIFSDLQKSEYIQRYHVIRKILGRRLFLESFL